MQAALFALSISNNDITTSTIAVTISKIDTTSPTIATTQPAINKVVPEVMKQEHETDNTTSTITMTHTLIRNHELRIMNAEHEVVTAINECGAMIPLMCLIIDESAVLDNEGVTSAATIVNTYNG